MFRSDLSTHRHFWRNDVFLLSATSQASNHSHVLPLGNAGAGDHDFLTPQALALLSCASVAWSPRQ
jgi:hypothetical protein